MPLLLVLFACDPIEPSFAPGSRMPDEHVPGSGTDAPEQDPGAGGADACNAMVAWISPDDETRGVPTDAPIRAGFDHPVPPNVDSWSLFVDGVAGSVSLSDDRMMVTFRPDAPLLAAAPYRAVASACGNEREAAFTTLGRPVPPDDLAERTWSLAVDDLRWVSPASAPLFVPLLDDTARVLVHAAAEPDGLHLHLRLAGTTGDLLWPVPCAPIIDLGRLDLSGNPRFSAGGKQITFRWLGRSVHLENVRVTGLLEAGGTRLSDLTFHALVDTRAIESLTSMDDVCALTAEFGDACEPCDDGAASCLPVLATQTSAHEAQIDIYTATWDGLGICP